ncbi:uncharacterized protein LOC131689534 [Topomyia yanbarensis]|uniref:uncharacterized protein LOC131689534 n=1 Tax=Topomyia yanbarensis TaxID=2498891 RepID=UPI00273C81D7|nr:uncharacterized protein LOC131689534 [Topomyia yanbarensis]
MQRVTASILDRVHEFVHCRTNTELLPKIVTQYASTTQLRSNHHCNVADIGGEHRGTTFPACSGKEHRTSVFHPMELAYPGRSGPCLNNSPETSLLRLASGCCLAAHRRNRYRQAVSQYSL